MHISIVSLIVQLLSACYVYWNYPPPYRYCLEKLQRHINHIWALEESCCKLRPMSLRTVSRHNVITPVNAEFRHVSVHWCKTECARVLEQVWKSSFRATILGQHPVQLKHAEKFSVKMLLTCKSQGISVQDKSHHRWVSGGLHYQMDLGHQKCVQPPAKPNKPHKSRGKYM